jgi:hypothetical protein
VAANVLAGGDQVHANVAALDELGALDASPGGDADRGDQVHAHVAALDELAALDASPGDDHVRDGGGPCPCVNGLFRVSRA